MKKVYIVLILVTLFLTGCSSNNQDNLNNQDNQQNEVGNYNVDIKDFAFSSLELRIKKGETVVWTNNDDVKHTITSDSGNELNSEQLSKSQTYSHTFNTVGTFNYHCNLHPNMKAKIIVE